MGGGAKGLAYVGAVNAARERFRFVSVAGSSAGAITATLVAARLDGKELQLAASTAMEKIKRQLVLGLVPTVGKTIYRIDGVTAWLDECLRDQVASLTRKQRSAQPVTFQELFEASKVELNVVAMDLHLRQPIVFNHTTTPTCQVAQAVMASSAIPLAMPPGRVIVREEDGSQRIHRLIDGGAWANYPSFVYNDASFRAHNEMPDIDPDISTVGFVLDPRGAGTPPRTDATALVGSKRRESDLGAGVRAGLPGMLLNWRFLRALLAVAFPVAVILMLFDWFVIQTDGFFPSLAFIADGAEPAVVALILIIGGLFAAFVIALALVLYRFASEMFDNGLPSLVATLSVGPRAPDWVGAADGDAVVRLTVPDGISTTTFNVDADKQTAIAQTAYGEAQDQLRESFPDQYEDDGS